MWDSIKIYAKMMTSLFSHWKGPLPCHRKKLIHAGHPSYTVFHVFAPHFLPTQVFSAYRKENCFLSFPSTVSISAHISIYISIYIYISPEMYFCSSVFHIIKREEERKCPIHRVMILAVTSPCRCRDPNFRLPFSLTSSFTVD